MTTTLSTSNARGSSRQTRTNPTRTSKLVGTTLRQDSLISNPPLPQPTNEPHGFYPAIQHFTDAITALPREYRRHTSLLKEVDAKAWAPEENLQTLLKQCLAETPARSTLAEPGSVTGSVHNHAEENHMISAANSVVGGPADNASQYSLQSFDPTNLQRRQLFQSLRHNLIQMMVTMDEKNHVINNANEELSRHLRRLDNIYPHIADEVSEEARLGSLKHWAFAETTVQRKAQSSRREAAASLATMHDTDIAQRSESRREAMLAKKHRLNQTLVDSDFDDTRATGRKNNMNGKGRRVGELAAESTGLGISGLPAGKRKKLEKPAAGGIGMERSLSGVLGGRAMSREPSQQDANKKRKAPASASNPARKRLNANTQDSPKLVSSPLAAAFGKDAYKRSPIPSSVRPVASRMRQNSSHNMDNSRARPSSSASHKPSSNGVTASIPELHSVAAMTGKTPSEVKSTMKESVNNKGDRLLEENTPPNGINGDAVRGGILLERSTSRSGALKREANASEESMAKNGSPRLPSLITSEPRGDRSGRGRASKTSTPVTGTFAESESGEGFGPTGNGNGNGKSKRPVRPRMKDHGLHDSLSPKALPPKRSHKKGAGLLAQQHHAQQQAQRLASGDVAINNIAVLDGLDMDNDDENGDGDEDEERYCYCNGVSYGEMVACDNKTCKKEWFHLDCVGLEKPPGAKAKWYCEDCKDIVAKRGRFGSVSNGSGGNGKQ